MWWVGRVCDGLCDGLGVCLVGWSSGCAAPGVVCTACWLRCKHTACDKYTACGHLCPALPVQDNSHFCGAPCTICTDQQCCKNNQCVVG